MSNKAKPTLKLTDFYSTQYVDYSSYDNLRKIASVIDGQKNASRKILCTILEKNIRKKIKVSQLASKVAEYTEYLHGDISGVVVTLGQDYTGSNNLPLLQKDGNFGTRYQNEASASRYIQTYGADNFFELFKREDNAVLKHQYFEGKRIEPMFYLPTLPILLINGSEGLSSGFSQKILPRNPEKIRQYLKSRLSGKGSYYKFEPYFNGFKGTIEQGDSPLQWIIKGVVQRKSINKVIITEVPIGYDLKGYIKVLDKLEDDKIIQSYLDKSEDDEFRFEVSIPSKSLKEWSDEELLTRLKLVTRVTENFTAFDENNRIQVYENAEKIIEKYIEVKMHYMQLRKDNIALSLETAIQFDESKYNFIKSIVQDELVINKRKKSDIVSDLEKRPDILAKDGSFDYLLNMSISTLTEERMKELADLIRKNKDELKVLKTKSLEQLWIEDLK